MPYPRTTSAVAHVHQVILVEEDAGPAALAEAHGHLADRLLDVVAVDRHVSHGAVVREGRVHEVGDGLVPLADGVVGRANPDDREGSGGESVGQDALCCRPGPRPDVRVGGVGSWVGIIMSHPSADSHPVRTKSAQVLGTGYLGGRDHCPSALPTPACRPRQATDSAPRIWDVRVRTCPNSPSQERGRFGVVANDATLLTPTSN